MSQQPPCVFRKWLQRPIESGYLEGHARRDQSRPSARRCPTALVCLDQPEFAKLSPKKAPRPYTRLCKLAGRKTHVLSNARFTATGEFANYPRRFANSRRKRAAACNMARCFGSCPSGPAGGNSNFLQSSSLGQSRLHILPSETASLPAVPYLERTPR